MKKDILRFSEIGKDDLRALIENAKAMKAGAVTAAKDRPLEGKSAVMIFEKPSTRTRVSFEIAVWQLGGFPVVLNSTDMQLGRGETIEDTGRVLSRYSDLIVIRSVSHDNLEKLASAAEVPVINALSDKYHPCQALADMLTIDEAKGRLEGIKLAYVGDGNNVCNSLMLAAATAGIDMRVATPDGYGPDKGVVDDALRLGASSGGSLSLTGDIAEAASGADVLYTDVWVSMGDEDESDQRKQALKRYQINDNVIKMADESVIVMHCMPAHRGEEIAEGVMEGKHSVILEQAGNRLHAEKALLRWIAS